MQSHFVPQTCQPCLVSDAPLRVNSTTALTGNPAFHDIPRKMDASWVASYGCADLGPAPSTPLLERHLLPVKAACEAFGIELPAGFVNRPHVGGDTCPFCAYVAMDQGYAPMMWNVHPMEDGAPPRTAPKPAGRKHGYRHQVFKCQMGYAVLHALIRKDRDEGRGDVRAHLLSQPWTPQQSAAA